MDNNHSVANSRDTSPSRDADNAPFDEPPPPSAPAAAAVAAAFSATAPTYKVKFMCSFGGRIQPRPHDNQLTYVGGDTKIVSVDRHVRFPILAAKLSSLAGGGDVCFKYQLPGEDLDALISVTNDEDLDHMMVEYDRLFRSSPRPARLRLILFPLPNNTNNNNNVPPPLPPPPSAATKPERHWFVDALNSVQLLEPSPSSSPKHPPPPLPALNPDFLFGLDKPRPAVYVDPSPIVPDFAAGESECRSEAVAETEIVRQMQEMQNLSQRKIGDENGVINGVESYNQNNSEKVAHSHAQAKPGPVHASGPVPVQGSLMHNPVGCVSGYSMPVSGTGTEPAPIYLIQTPSGIYQAVTPVTGPVGPGPIYLIQTPSTVPHPAMVGYSGPELGAAAERGYSQVAYTVRQPAAAATGSDGLN